MMPIKITANTKPFKHTVLVYGFSIILLPILSYFLFPIINIPGVIVLMFFWLIFVIYLIIYFKSSKIYCEITQAKVNISDGKNIINLDISEIEDINLQAIVAKRMGIYEIYACLAFKISDKEKNQLKYLKSHEFGFIQTIKDLKSYMSEQKQDLYILAKDSLEEEDFKEIKKVIKKPIKKLKPLIKTDNQEEYDKILNEYFDN